MNEELTHNRPISRRLSHIVCQWVFDTFAHTRPVVASCFYEILRERIRLGPVPGGWKEQPGYLQSSDCLEKSDDQIIWHLFSLYKDVPLTIIHEPLRYTWRNEDSQVIRLYSKKRK